MQLCCTRVQLAGCEGEAMPQSPGRSQNCWESRMTLIDYLTDLFTKISNVDFLGSILTGIVGSVLTWLFVSIGRRLAQRRRYADYAGRYETYTIEGARIKDEHIRVKWLGSNLLFARSESQDGIWESFITLDKAVPHVGKGFFQYHSRVDFGVHEIQRTLEKDKIFIFAHNPALSKPTSAYVWKKVV